MNGSLFTGDSLPIPGPDPGWGNAKKLAGVAIWQQHIGNFIPPSCSGIAADAQFAAMPYCIFSFS
jgi:hypothetical protein